VSGTTNRAPELAREQQVRSADLLAMGVVHRIVPEQPPAHIDPAGFCQAVARQIAAAVGEQLAARKA
jgi:acyl-CoA carboxylase subunit beta